MSIDGSSGTRRRARAWVSSRWVLGTRRALRSLVFARGAALNETQVKDASERWRHARSSGGSWRTSPSEHSTLARALGFSPRARRRGPGQGRALCGGPVRGAGAAALRAPVLESIATLVSSPNRDASRARATPSTRSSTSSPAPPPRDRARSSPSPSPTAPPAPTPTQTPPLGTASADLRLNARQARTPSRALRDVDAAAVAAERLARLARENLTVSIASPAALVVAALAPRAELFHRVGDSPAFRRLCFVRRANDGGRASPSPRSTPPRR